MPEMQNWEGGGVIDETGRLFMPNLPSYEVFASPNRLEADGYVEATLPLNYQGQLIERLRLVLSDNPVIVLLGQILHEDAGSSRLGEIAIVEQSSPIARQQRIFYNVVYDENASCHMALGKGFFRCTPEEALSQNINVSGIHVDFMFGSDDMCIRGQLPDGTWEDIMRDGTWVLTGKAP